jgi:DnaJ-class molecular chaperone
MREIRALEPRVRGCPDCRGQGEIDRDGRDAEPESEVCRLCNGSGELWS